jgi:hypothetical protein
MAERLDVYDVACLAGGTDRVVDTALVALVRSGRVRVHALGELATVSLTRRHPVEAAVLDAVGPAGHRSVDTIRWRLASDDRILDVARRLRDAGLLGTSPVPRARRSRWRPVPTYAGRHALHELRDGLGADAEVMAVAFGGREAMSDKRLCSEIFEQPASMPVLERGRPPHELAFADGWQAARRARAEILKDAHWLGPAG